MWIGIIVGVGIGMTATTFLYGFLLTSASQRANKTSDTVEALLIRKSEGIERIATALESK